MSKEHQKHISRRDFLKIGAASVAVGALALEAIEGHEKTQIQPYSQDLFTPFTLESTPFQQAPQPMESMPLQVLPSAVPEQPKHLSKKERLLSQARVELPGIVEKMKEHPKNFSKKKIKDVKMYYPIYKAIADKYNVDWYLIFIIHEAETGASAGKRGFAPDSFYKGAMQIAPMWIGLGYMDPDSKNFAAKGLGFLKSVPQRHKDDWKNIAAGTKILKRNMRGKHKDALNGLLHYCSEDQAHLRFRRYKKYKKIFNERKEKPENVVNKAAA